MKHLSRSCALSLVLAGAGALPLATPAHAAPSAAAALSASRCGASSAHLLGWSDALDKTTAYGAAVGGLSDIAWDARSASYVSSVDNNKTDSSRLFFYRNLADPTPSRAPLVLRQPDGTAYTGQTADNEGLAVDAQGDFVVSSEVEPSIRIFGRDGVQKAQLPVPARFAVAPAGQATSNATLEGLTLSPDKRTMVASMEGTLSGDAPADGSPASYRRFLVYQLRHGQWRLAEQLGYRVETGNRIAEVQEYAPGKLLVLEASWTADAGNQVQLFTASTRGAQDVSGIDNLSTRPDLVLDKQLAVDVATCPSDGATALEAQANPLMDNFEGMTTRRLFGHEYLVTLVSDDNYSAKQHTRVVNLAVRLP